jgi:hypothetical protein
VVAVVGDPTADQFGRSVGGPLDVYAAAPAVASQVRSIVVPVATAVNPVGAAGAVVSLTTADGAELPAPFDAITR